MEQLGYDRTYVDAAGNAVGEIGPTDAGRLVILLGHIDTVPGNIPVRITSSGAGRLLYGRGSVDAKGPLATFVSATARLGSSWAAENNIRIVVVGAVEEEAATSKGARFIRDRFNGKPEPLPAACVIGEPSSWNRITLGYKGRILVEMEAVQPMAHTAGPDVGVATVAIDLWNWLARYADQYNAAWPKAFDQFMPSLRSLHTATDEAMWDRVSAQVGIRLPVDFDAMAFTAELITWAASRAGVATPALNQLISGAETLIHLDGDPMSIDLHFRGYEPAWRSERDTLLARCFLAAIRGVASETRPSYVVKTGTSDMNVVGPAWNCPILAYGPGDSSLDHTPKEHVNLSEYWQAVLVLEQALRHCAVLFPA